jgi:hypothetical protein
LKRCVPLSRGERPKSNSRAPRAIAQRIASQEIRLSTLSRTSSAARAGSRSGFPLGISVFDHDVATLDVTEIPQSLTEGHGRVGGSGQVDHRQEAYSKDRGRQLRAGGERRDEEIVEAAFPRRNDSWS